MKFGNDIQGNALCDEVSPKISVICPLFNKEQYIVETIQSLQAQSYSNWELLIVDNGSTDNSVDKVKNIEETRLQLLRSPQRGPGAARNFGLKHSVGDWVLFLDADDLLEPDYLATQIQTVTQHPTASIVAAGWQEFQDDAPQQRVVKQPAGLGQSLQQLRDGAIAFVPWAVHAAMIRRSALLPECHWPEALDGFLGEDLAFWFRLVSRYLVAHSACQGALYRIHTPHCRTQNRDVEKWFTGLHAAVSDNLQDCQRRSSPLTAGQCESLTRLYSQLYQQALKAKHDAVAKETLQLARSYLQQYLAIAPQPKPSMRLRYLLGLRLFSQLATHLS
ncbi:glycosyltransferase family 2 protein [Leptolyngbya sp. FACHB-16]|uniref:glycosyltransferase family 2 protein n=1 Tax=unclassified Leptolyngbya TaxID=2650499 RepID=UPI001689C42D|nr:glycosyltransferase family 2 protein [Leptolyngbya sp. FACHB-16]MBD2156180.1 glycosyltransferase family 2 protein [Leptolyngbya sp. FACHB-16]